MKLNIKDVSSQHCQQQKGVMLTRLNRYDRKEQGWQEVLVEDRHAGPAEIACVKIDFADWLRMLPGQKRRIAETLACGESHGVTAKKFKVSSSRISRFRKECFTWWQEFQGEPTETAEAAA